MNRITIILTALFCFLFATENDALAQASSKRVVSRNIVAAADAGVPTRTSIKNRRISQRISSYNSPTTTTTTTATAIPIKGYNVNYVAYKGSQQGSFEKAYGNKWIEFKKDSRNPHATFTETHRDEWSVYLTKSDGAKLQLDLHTKKITFNRNPLYTVAEAKFVLNGYSANYVAYKGSQTGSFEQTGNKKWTEFKKGSRTPHATFIETHRDEWSVYLTKSDGAKLQLDLHTKKITFNRNPLYTVAEAKHIVNGYNVNHVEYGGSQSGRFEQTGDKTWREMKTGQSGVHATFTETGRDEWSVYMTKSDGARIQLDLHTKKVSINRSVSYEIQQVFAQ